MKKIFTTVFVIIGALIGAGFASGQEIYSFFFVYGINGIYGLIITNILLTFLIYKILKVIYYKKTENYSEFLKVFIKNEKMISIINTILNILLLLTFYIMIAGFGAYFEQEIGINKVVGSGILIILCYFVFKLKVTGIIEVSKILIPLLIFFIIIIGGINLYEIELCEINIEPIKKNWLFSAITYCSYNIVLLIPVLISLKNQISKVKEIKVISFLSGLISLFLSIIIFTLLLKIDTNIESLEMPIVYTVSKYYNKFKIIYAFIILISIFTTAISIGTGFLQNLNIKEKSYTQFVLFMCITSLIISNFGFSNLVKNGYPIFGYIGIIQIVLILLKNICKK